MASLDFSLPDTIDLSPGIAAVGDALTDVLKRKQQQKQFDQQMEFNREQEERKFKQAQMNIDYQNRLAANQEVRGQRDFAMRQDDHVAAVKQRARTAPNAQISQSILDDLRIYDPETGKETGRGKLTPGPLKGVGPEPTLDPKPELGPELQDAVPDILQMMPGAPPELAARLRGKARPQPTYGPFATPEEQAAAEPAQRRFDVDLAAYQADQRGGGDRLKAAQAAQDKFGAETAAYDDAVDAFPARQRDFQARQRHAENTRPYTMSVGPNDKGTTFDFETQRHAEGKDAAERFLSSLPATVDTQTRQAAQVVAGYLESGTIKSDQAGVALQKVLAQGVGEAGKNSRSTAEIAGRETVAHIMASRPRASVVVGEGNLNMRKFEQFEKDAERIGNRVGAKVDIAGIKQLDDGLAGLGSKNQALEQGIVFQIARSMQGVGPLTQQDVEIIRKDIAGKGGTLESWMQRLDDGHLGEQEKAVFYGALQARRRNLGARMQKQRAQVDKHFLREKSPYRAWVGDDHIISTLDTMFPGTVNTVDFDTPQTPPPPEIGAGKRGKKRVSVSGTKNPVEDVLNLYEGAK